MGCTRSAPPTGPPRRRSSSVAVAAPRERLSIMPRRGHYFFRIFFCFVFLDKVRCFPIPVKDIPQGEQYTKQKRASAFSRHFLLAMAIQ